MPTFSDSLTLRTRLGGIVASYSVAAEDLSLEQVAFRAISMTPKLPPGMNVERCIALLLTVEGLVDLERISLEVKFDTAAEGAPCSGQHLDAQEWSANGHLVVFGAEDGEALSYRFPGLGLEDQAVTEFSTRGMKLRLARLGAQKCPSFHFIIAENGDPEPVEGSAWFAVDQDHRFVLAS